MKLKHSLVFAAFAAAMVLVSGCDKKPATETTETTPAPADTNGLQTQMNAVTDQVKQTTDQVVAGTKETAAQVTTEVKQAADSAATTASTTVDSMKANAQSLIDKAKELINNKQYENALASLKQLSNFKLTPEQQKTVDDLKAQLQKLMSSQVVTNAASALGNMLNK